MKFLGNQYTKIILRFYTFLEENLHDENNSVSISNYESNYLSLFFQRILLLMNAVKSDCGKQMLLQNLLF